MSVFRKENGRICPEEVFTFPHDLVLLFLCQAVRTFVVDSLAAVGPLTVRDLKEMQDQTIAPMTSVLPQASPGDVKLPHRAKQFAYPALQKVVIAKLIVVMCQLTVNRIWATEGEKCPVSTSQ
jgi:hypothetical protein